MLLVIFKNKKQVNRLMAEIEGLCLEAYREPPEVKKLLHELEELLEQDEDNGVNQFDASI